MTDDSSMSTDRGAAAAYKSGEPLEIPPRTWLVWAISINLFIAFTRILALRNSPLDLLPDEAQYWSWSRHLAFGYFSKPPVIAWLIAATTALAGNDEWGVRLGAPLVHAATGIVIAFIGRAMFNARVGFFSALLYATIPGVIFSGLIISTDVPLLFFWALALLAIWEMWSAPDWRWAVILGVAFGLGFLAKYAMGYFLLGALVLAAQTPRARLKAAARYLILAVLIAAAIIAPNLIWNSVHGWATVGHTAANANWGEGGGLHLREAAAFAGAQFGVFGPILLVALIVRLILWRRDPPRAAERFLLAFAVPVLLMMIVQSGISRAHANWAAVSYIAATVLVVGWLDRIRQPWPVRISLVLQLAVFVGFTMYFAGSIDVKLSKNLDMFHQMRGWHSLAQLVRHRVDTAPAGSSVAADDREVMAELDYYLRNRFFPLVIATGNGPPGNQYELENAITAANGQNVLLIARYADRHDILDKFAEHKLTEEWNVGAGQGRRRGYFIYELSGFKGN
ncbi:MAG: phospholipid carrier-dependent glycosyltransferase [Rhodospirillales bacterium]|nr:phospholipid carrier-dependent glycosyltransferase [Rhodospirillales bacterium]